MFTRLSRNVSINCCVVYLSDKCYQVNKLVFAVVISDNCTRITHQGRRAVTGNVRHGSAGEMEVERLNNEEEMD